MPLKLHKNCREKIVSSIENNLEHILVDNNKYLQRISCFFSLYNAEKALPDNGKLHDKIVNFISENPLMDFISDRLAIELFELDQYQSDVPPKKLTEIEGFDDPKVVAKRLVAEFESLPWKYTHTVKLPVDVSEFLAAVVNRRDLSPNIRLVLSDPPLSKEFPLNSSDERKQNRIHPKGLLSIRDPESFSEGSVYLQIGAEGFVDQYGSSMPAFQANRILRAFFGLGLALRLFNIQFRYNPFQSKAHFFVHRWIDDSWIIDGKYELDEAQTDTLNKLAMHTLDGKLKKDDEKRAWALRRLNDVQAVFSAGDKSDFIILASQWLFDSYTGRDELLNFIQAMVVLEILLGDESVSSELGLGQTLRNRCAYLIGSSHKQRAELLNDFNEIYRIRSQIVHRGKPRLSAEERGLFSTLRWMCRRVIQEEVKLLKADLEKS